MGTYTGTDSNNSFTATQEWKDWYNPTKVWKDWKIVGKGSNDTLDGGAKTDTIYGDFAFGVATGLSGNDVISGRGGNDIAYGEGGDDVIYGDYKFGTVAADGGVSGNDTLDGGFGNDRLYGEAGSDVLKGGYGTDYLNGFGAGTGRYEKDVLTGGGDADSFVLGTRTMMAYYGDGINGYATINDFTINIDKILVQGSRDQYDLNKTFNFGGGSSLDTAIMYKGDVIGVVLDRTNIEKTHLTTNYNSF